MKQKNGKLLTTLDGKTENVSFASFSANGQYILTVTTEGAARIWDVHPETRSPSEVAKIVQQDSPFRFG